MATPKKKRNYTIFYNDGTYMTFELTKDDFEEIETGLTAPKTHASAPTYASVSIGVIGLGNIKAIIEQKEEEPEEETPTDTNPPLDQESYNWIKEQIGGF